MAREWTKEQQRAIDTSGGTLLVSAAAGSGKTAVLVERLISRITDRENPVDADKFLVVTFTKAAAAEMRERVSKRLRELLESNPSDTFLQHQILLLEQAQICTIDSFFSNVVRENFEILGVSPTLRVADDSLLVQIKAEVIEEVLEKKYNEKDEKFLKLIDYFGTQNDNVLKEKVLDIYNKIRSLPFPLKWLDDMVSLYKGDTPVAETIWGKTILKKIHEGVGFCEQIVDRMFFFIANDAHMKDAYTPACTSDSEEVDCLKAACEKGSWNDIYNVLNNFHYAKLSSAKNCIPEFKERFKKLRDMLKAEIDALQKLICCTEENYLSDMKIQSDIIEAFADVIKSFYAKLEEEKQELNIGDFSDFAYFTLQLMADENGNPTEFAKAFSQQFEEIMLDEYQDTNPLQDLIFRCISKDNGNLFFVGDLKQSIYRFRNADPEVFKTKKDSFSPIEKGTFPASIMLSKNFRSRKGITEFINSVFETVMSEELGDVEYTDEEKLNCGATYYPEISHSEVSLQIIDLAEEDSEEGKIVIEAIETAKQISKMITEKMPVTENGVLRPCRSEDFAILLRSTKGGVADIYAKALEEENITADSDSSTGYFASREVSVMISLLKVLDNPMLDLEMSAVLLSPMFSFTCDDLASLFVYHPKKSLFASLLSEADNGNKKAKAFMKTFLKLREKSAVMTVRKLIQYIYDTTDFIEVVSGMAGSAVREANLKLLLKYALDFESLGNNELSNFIIYINSVIETENDFNVATPAIQSSQAVKIMTIHKSKGLEFPVVIVANCSKLHNLMDIRDTVSFNSKLGLGLTFIDREKLLKYPTIPETSIKAYEKQCLLSEEMRLLYVALTRAREKLILNITEKDLGKKLTKRLEFLLDNKGNAEPYVASKCGSYADWILLSVMTLDSFAELRHKYGIVSAIKEGAAFDLSTSSADITVRTAGKSKRAKPDEEILKTLKEKVFFEYPYINETKIPAKLSVTEITHKKSNDVYLAPPKFMAKEGFSAAQKGSIFHRVLQFADFSLGRENAEAELLRLKEKGYLTEEEFDTINLNKLEAFFNSELTDRILKADRVLREYKFFDTVTAKEAGFEGDAKILIQGIADCVIEENGEGVLIDFKTDAVSDPSVLINRYKSQLALYKRTLDKLFPKGIRECIIYSLHLGKEIKL